MSQDSLKINIKTLNIILNDKVRELYEIFTWTGGTMFLVSLITT